MTELELRLAELRDELVFPPTPAFELVLERRSARRWGPLAVALVALLVLAAGALALSPGARSAFLELFRLRGATIELSERSPVFDRQTNRSLGVPVSLEEARESARFTVLVPEGYSGVTYDARLNGVTFGWAEQRLFLTELRGQVLPLISKSAGPGTTIRYVDVNGRAGYWLSGARHRVVFRTGTGRFVESRAAGNVLLWEQAGLLLRLEGAETLAQAMRVAGTVDP